MDQIWKEKVKDNSLSGYLKSINLQGFCDKIEELAEEDEEGESTSAHNNPGDGLRVSDKVEKSDEEMPIYHNKVQEKGKGIKISRISVFH